ncbi:hypothetical protein [Exiguobacterium aurantiacum]|uniref:Uncharacterized protein n=1 Tax=Exiguobacterium aurantiacum TaxID=33987 RepID=A0ABY5FLP0_9BACL|nr:hypothetical protein [Exiguobacterium aurantiacum]UTT42515.1 hypothetical protein NMQ00_13435 [Exiguobacterium aurantiacum]
MALHHRTDQEREQDKTTSLMMMSLLCWFLYGLLYGFVYFNVLVIFFVLFSSFLGVKGLIARDKRIEREREVRDLGVEIDSEEGEMLMKREYATYEVTGYDDKGKIKFIHLREGEFVLPVEIKGDDLTKIKKMMELNPGVTVIVHAAVDQKRMRLQEIDGYSLRKES